MLVTAVSAWPARSLLHHYRDSQDLALVPALSCTISSYRFAFRTFISILKTQLSFTCGEILRSDWTLR